MAREALSDRIGMDSILANGDASVDGVLQGLNSLQEGGTISGEMEWA